MYMYVYTVIVIGSLNLVACGYVGGCVPGLVARLGLAGGQAGELNITMHTWWSDDREVSPNRTS